MLTKRKAASISSNEIVIIHLFPMGLTLGDSGGGGADDRLHALVRRQVVQAFFNGQDGPAASAIMCPNRRETSNVMSGTFLK